MRVFALRYLNKGALLYLGSVDGYTTTEYDTILTELVCYSLAMPAIKDKLMVITFVPEEVTPVVETLYKLTR